MGTLRLSNAWPECRCRSEAGECAGNQYPSHHPPPEKINTEARRLSDQGILHLDKHEYEKATAVINQALKLDIANSYLHFLNALVYHIRSKQEGAQYTELALEGYKQALKFDASNWLAQYHLGLIYMDQRQFGMAQYHFSQVVLYESDDPEILYQLAAASYYAQDLRTAEAILSHLRSLSLSKYWEKRVTKVSSLTKAALNQPAEMKEYFFQYKNLESNPSKINNLLKRVKSWTRTHQVASDSVVAQADDDPFASPVYEREPEPSEEEPVLEGRDDSEDESSEGRHSESQEEEDADFLEHQMAVVEVTIIRTEEDMSTSKGVNLLSGLQIQFGDVSAGTPALSIANNHVRDFINDNSDASHTNTLTSLITVPAISYSLNIANSQSGRNEILARPTLVARAGQTSEFFSGVEVAAAATSGGAGDSISIEKEIGVKLAVTPEFLPNNAILLKVDAERTFLTQPSRSVEFEFRLDTSKTTVNANVVMKFGQTLILSGLSERETENNRDGVPGIQDIPFFQYFFSRATTRDFRKSVLVLMTPRRTQYLHEKEADRIKRISLLSEEEKQISQLENKYSDWFSPVPATSSIFQHLNTNSLYKNEFRTGDFPVEKWNSKQTHWERLREAIDFLYY